MKIFGKATAVPPPQEASIALRLSAITNRVKSEAAIYEGWARPNERR